MLEARALSVAFAGVPALAGATLEVAAGERLALLGPSGSGKSTLLRVVAGLQAPDAGRVLLAGADVTNVPPHRRRVGLMFQDDALFPHRNVGENVAFGPRVAGRPPPEIARRVAGLLDLVGLGGYAARPVATLSGGEAQRVALARALAPEPRVLLLDEPLASLDGPLRDRLRDDLAALFERLELTVVHVTHDVGEAFALGDRVAVMRNGRIVQIASPDALWSQPADPWIARFLGMENVRDGEVVRPEAVLVARARRDGNATVITAGRRGALVRVRVRLDSGEELDAVTTALDHPGDGQRADVSIDPAGVVRFAR